MNVFDSIQPKNNTPEPVPAKKLDEKIIGIVVYPEPIKKYSINEALQERDEFRKSVLQNSREAEAKKKHGKRFKFALLCVLTAAAFRFIKKKK